MILHFQITLLSGFPSDKTLAERDRQQREEQRAGVHRAGRMTSDLDIWCAAKLLVGDHGADAPIRAAQRADELLAADDIEGRAVWLRIIAVVKELQSTKPPSPAH